MSSWYLRPVRLNDNSELKTIITDALIEHKCEGEGYSSDDKSLNDLYSAYSQARCVYFVVLYEGKLCGGGGIAPLSGQSEKVCELQKLYFHPDFRKHGFGQRVLDRCLEQAMMFGYEECYLETTEAMTKAQEFYLKNGFSRCPKKDASVHKKCTVCFEKRLTGQQSKL